MKSLCFDLKLKTNPILLSRNDFPYLKNSSYYSLKNTIFTLFRTNLHIVC